MQTSISDSDRSSFLLDIFSDECVVTNVFQQLGDMEKTYIFRMIYLDRPLKEQVFKFWSVPPPVGLNPKQIYEPPLQNLVSLGILQNLGGTGDDVSYDMHPGFRGCIQSTISRPRSEPKSSVLNFLTAPSRISAGDETKWHTLLERIISASQAQTEALSDMDRVILRLGFGTDPRPPASYRFVLADVHTQLWTLLNEFAVFLERERMGLSGIAEMIRTIAGLMTGLTRSSSTTLQIDHKAGQLVKRTILFLSEMDCVRNPSGDVPFQKPQSWLGPTAAALHSSKALIGREDLLLGSRLVVDSNMHVSAYTRSQLQRQLIGMFCEMHRRIGNVVTGVLTRKSVQTAIDSGGVSSDSIVRFLSANLHPSCGGKIPTNVALQIKLWESDCPRNRLRVDPCVTFTWRGDRSEQASSAIAQIKMIAEAQKGLLFLKQDADGCVHIGIRADIAKSLLTR